MTFVERMALRRFAMVMESCGNTEPVYLYLSLILSNRIACTANSFVGDYKLMIKFFSESGGVIPCISINNLLKENVLKKDAY